MTHALLSFLGRNLIKGISLLIAVSVLAFILVSVSPIDPLRSNVGEAAMAAMSPEQIEKLQAYWGTDQAPLQRYLHWAGDFIRGDMGTSLLYRQPVAQIIMERFSNSFLLLALAWVLSGILGLVLGVIAGSRRRSWLDKAIKGGALVIASTPAFWLALVLLMVFAVHWPIFPIGFSMPIGIIASEVGWGDRLFHLVLPALTLSLVGMANIILHTREKMIDIMESDYVLYAQARGESHSKIVRRHGLRNVLLPAMTLQFASISEIFGGSVLVEQVFSYPGLGQAAVQSGLGGDVPLLLGIAVISAAIVFTGNLIANLLYGVIDPQIRRGQMYASR